MKKIKKGITLVVLFVICFIPTMAFADCSDEEEIQLNRESFNVNGSYSLQEVVKDFDGEIVDIDLNDVHQDDDYYSDTLSFLEIRNITENLYITIEESGTIVDEVYYYDTDDGTYIFQVPDVEKIRTYDIKMFSNLDSCKGKEVNNISVKTPMRNPLASLAACMNVEESYCDEFVTTKVNITEDEIIKRKEPYTQPQEEEEINQNDFFKKYGIYILVGVLVIGVVSTVIVLVKRRRSRGL